MNTELTIEEKLDFCARSANTPLAIEAFYPIGKHSIGIEGWYNPEDGDIAALLQVAFTRYFGRIRASVNINSEEDGYYRFEAKLTAKIL